MEAIVYVIGAGGSGGAIGGNQDQAQNARGGAAGGCAVSRLTLAAQNYTVTIGSGGDDVGTANAVAGDAGGNSELSGTGITTMTANGVLLVLLVLAPKTSPLEAVLLQEAT